jgi:hypothetical protein
MRIEGPFLGLAVGGALMTASAWFLRMLWSTSKEPDEAEARRAAWEVVELGFRWLGPICLIIGVAGLVVSGIL